MGARIDWGLTVELGGGTYHFATRAVSVASVDYTAGLGELTLSRKLNISGDLALTISSIVDWPAKFAAARWLVDGGSASLHLIVENDGAFTRHLWMKGTANKVEWGPKGNDLLVSVTPAGRQLQIPALHHRIDPYTAPTQDSALPVGTSSYVIHTPHQGLHYPTIIGYPGNDDRNSEIRPVVPLPTMQYTEDTVAYDGTGNVQVPEILVYVVGDSRIDATKCVFNETGFTRKETSGTGAEDHAKSIDGVHKTLTLVTADDKLGQAFKCATVDLTSTYDSGGANYEVEDFEGQPAGYAGFGSVTGGGVKWQGSVMRGASQIAEWIVSQYTDLNLDLGAHRSAADYLDRYAFDTFLTAQQLALDWFESEIRRNIPAEWVIGDDGVYLAHIPLSPAPEQSELDVIGGLRGFAQWVSTSTTENDDIANEITYRWAPCRDGETYFNSLTLTKDYQRTIAVPGGALYYDQRAIGNALCRVSIQTYGVRPHTLDMPNVWAQATASLIASDVAYARALPQRTFSYRVPTDYYYLRPGSVVTLTDPDLSITGVICTVTDVKIGTASIEVDLRPGRTSSDYL